MNIYVADKNSNQKVPVEIDLIITKTMSDESDINLKNDNFKNNENTYSSTFELKEPTNWIITGSFKVEDNIGYVFIKTNAK